MKWESDTAGVNKQINNSKKNPIGPNFLNVYIIFSMEINYCLIGLEFQFGKMKKSLEMEGVVVAKQRNCT